LIKINLCPIDELENQYWWVPDVVVFAAIAISAYFGVQYYMGLVEEEIAIVQAEAADLKSKHDSLKPDLERFKDLGVNIQELNTKIEALKKITVSRIGKYRPIIVLEHFHNLKPEGMWFDEISIGRDLKFNLKGQAFDNILVSEFIGNLRATSSQNDDKSDIRTQVYFETLGLVITETKQEPNPDYPDISNVPNFAIQGQIRERGVAMEVDQEAGAEETLDLSGATTPSGKARM
jgi:hypothetical protein